MKKFEYVSYVDVNLPTGKGQLTVYANSWDDERVGDAAQVTIIFVVTNRNYEQVILTEKEIKECVFLGDYHTGEIFQPTTAVYWDRWAVDVDSVVVNTQAAVNAGVVYQSITYNLRSRGYHTISHTCAAVLTPDGGESIVTSCKGTQFDSGVTVTPLPAIWYDYSDLDYTRVDTQNKTVGNYVVDQDNYYVSIPNGTISDSSSSSGNADIFVKAKADVNPPIYQIVFKVGAEGTYNLKLDNGDIIPLPYNQRYGQLCLTRVSIENCTVSSPFSDEIKVTAYDPYQNVAYLAFSPKDNNNTISMSNA